MDDAVQIRRLAGQCLKRIPLDRKLRLLGVRAGSLVRADAPASPVVVAPDTGLGRTPALF